QRPIFVRAGSHIRRHKLFAGHFGHGCEHAFVLDAARLQLLRDHPLTLRRKIGGRWGLLAAARGGDRSKKQVMRDDSHLPKDNAACAAANEALRLLETRYRTAVTAFM